MDKKYDVLIIGCGVAGLYTSLSLPENLSVLVLSKQDETVSNSSLAQGGVAAVLSLENDSYELHYNDTMIAGGQANTPDAVNTLVHEGPDQVRQLINTALILTAIPTVLFKKRLRAVTAVAE